VLQKDVDADSVKAIGRNLSALKIAQMMFWEDLARKKALTEQGKISLIMVELTMKP